MALVELVRLPNGAEAELLRGRLDSAGVHAVCFDAGMNIAESVGLLIPVRVMVLDEDLVEAQALIEAFEAPQAQPGRASVRPELVEGPFFLS